MNKLIIDGNMTKALLYLTYIISRLLSLSYRVHYLNQNNLQNGGHIYAIWHQSLFMALCTHRHDKCAMIVSASKDGEYVATACKHYGHYPVRGSSHRGGVKALIEMIKVLKTKPLNGAITVDGPKGPAFEVKKGIIDIAKKSHRPIIALSCYPEKYWEFKSWDRFRLPKPFSRIIINYSPPIIIPQNFVQEEYDNKCQLLKSLLITGEKNAKEALTDK